MLDINKVYLGNCLELMKEIENNSIDFILCDLPYGTTKCKWDVVIPFDELWLHYNRIIKDNGAILLFGVEPFSSYLRLSNIKNYRYDWYWNKKRAANFLFTNKQPGRIVETISVFYKKQPTYNPQKRENPLGIQTKHLAKNPSKITKNVKSIMGETWTETKVSEGNNYFGKNYESDKLLPTTILEFVKPTKRTHPTQKPLELLEYLIKTYSNDGDIILDNCSGSGSTLRAAKNLNRNFIGIELEKVYYDSSIFLLEE